MDKNGLYYMRARYYNIYIMRFINQDILKGSIDSSQSLNRYAYVEGNPVNFLDPFGLDENKHDTSTAHTVLKTVAMGAFWVGAFLSPAGTLGFVVYAIGCGAALADSALYTYDAYNAETVEEMEEDCTNAGLSALTAVTGSLSYFTGLKLSIATSNGYQQNVILALNNKSFFVNLVDLVANAAGW